MQITKTFTPLYLINGTRILSILMTVIFGLSAFSHTLANGTIIQKKNGLNLSGTVVSSHGPLPGATVHIKDSETVTVTDTNGKFNFPVELEEGDVLVISFIGFQTQELVIEADTPSFIEITMIPVDIYIGAAPLTTHQSSKKTSVMSRIWQSVKAVF